MTKAEVAAEYRWAKEVAKMRHGFAKPVSRPNVFNAYEPEVVNADYAWAREADAYVALCNTLR